MENKKSSNEKIKIVCTTGMLGDMLKNIVAQEADIITLMGPGVDPHLYKATQGDLKSLTDADIIVYNGLHLEGKMTEVLQKLNKTKKVIAATDGLNELDLIKSADFAGNYDPHIWFDAFLWKKASTYIANELQKEDKLNKDVIKKNLNSYGERLDSLHLASIQSIQQIEFESRILITAHDAFSYFGRAYDMEVKGLQGISTLSEYGLKDISDMTNFILENKIKAIFIESSVSERSINAVIEGCKAKGHTVIKGGTLYSDAMGEDGTAEGSYIGMFHHNVNTIKNALK